VFLLFLMFLRVLQVHFARMHVTKLKKEVGRAVGESLTIVGGVYNAVRPSCTPVVYGTVVQSEATSRGKRLF